MPKKVTREQCDAVLRLLAQGQDRDTIAAAVGVTPGQVSGIPAHVKCPLGQPHERHHDAVVALQDRVHRFPAPGVDGHLPSRPEPLLEQVRQKEELHLGIRRQRQTIVEIQQRLRNGRFLHAGG
jgi:hypothetical protein